MLSGEKGQKAIESDYGLEKFDEWIKKEGI